MVYQGRGMRDRSMEDGDPKRVTPGILPGGSGTRLGPLSRQLRPKQSLALTATQTMLRLTADRVSNRDQFDRPIIVANTQHLIWLADELDAMGESLLLLEPAGRNTAPAIALAALQVPPDTILLALPSDHLI